MDQGTSSLVCVNGDELASRVPFSVSTRFRITLVMSHQRKNLASLKIEPRTVPRDEIGSDLNQVGVSA